MAACESCGTSNPDGFRFCGACGRPVTASPPPGEERKLVTVLFCDLAGFTARAETLDPEDVRAFLVPYYDILTAEITRHGGLVDRFLGDGVMALFGAPIAHEDDPERAVRAALRILGRIPSLDLDLHARVGINTGEVLFAAGQAGERDDAVTGDAVNTAARLQAAAPVDTVVVGASTYRATAHLFRYEALTPILAKGKAAPVPLWRPHGPIARRAGELPQETTSFVGRGVERALLVSLFERARSTPSLELATIVAEPGLGKSRLVRELARYLEALPDLVTWRLGRCLPYGDGVGLWALGEIVKEHAGILDTDDHDEVSAKIDAVLTEPDPSLRAWMKDRVGALVGLRTGSAPPQQAEAFTAWRRFIESIARSRPTVLVVEDLHLADDTLVAFLVHLADHGAGLPLLLVTTARPEIDERHPAWLSRTRHNSVLSLAALPEPSMAELVGELIPGASPEMTATILERASGSPLYAEQIAAILRDRPATRPAEMLDEAAVPPSIAALLAARIDALPDTAKAVLLDASVIGRTFWPGAVAAVGGRERGEVERQLATLVHQELIRPAYPSSVDGEAELVFWHTLLRDVAYGKLTRKARLAKHVAAATWITGRLAGSLGKAGEIVVAHLDQALELAHATGAISDVPAIEAFLVAALLDSADQASRTQALRAPAHLRRALELMAHGDRRRADVLARLGRALLATSEYADAAANLEAAVAILRADGATVAAAELGVPTFIALRNAGLLERATAVIDESRATLERNPGPGLVAVLAEQAHEHMTHYAPAALGNAVRALELAASIGVSPPHRALVARGLCRYPDDPVGGEEDVRAGIEGSIRGGDVRAAMVALVNLASMVTAIDGAAPGAWAFDEAIAFAESHGLPTEDARTGRLGAMVDAGQWDELLQEADLLVAWANRHGDAYTEVAVRLASARVRLERGEAIGPQDALAGMARETGWVPPSTAPIQAEAALAAHDRRSARDALASAIDATESGQFFNDASFVRACLRIGALDLARRALTIGSTPALGLADRAHASAQVAEASGDLASARAGYERVVPELARLGNVPEHAYAVAGLGRCLLALGETEKGIELLLEARATWERLRATPRIAEIDAVLAASPTPGPVPTPGAGSRPPGV